MSSSSSHDAVVREIASEKAGALSRVAEALERALADLARADAAVAAATRATAALLAYRQDCLSEAGERLWYLVIQREALGLMRHDTVFDVYRVPREVRLAMGPRRRPG
jgi:hypothetical protein